MICSEEDSYLWCSSDPSYINRIFCLIVGAGCGAHTAFSTKQQSTLLTNKKMASSWSSWHSFCVASSSWAMHGRWEHLQISMHCASNAHGTQKSPKKSFFQTQLLPVESWRPVWGLWHGPAPAGYKLGTWPTKFKKGQQLGRNTPACQMTPRKQNAHKANANRQEYPPAPPTSYLCSHGCRWGKDDLRGCSQKNCDDHRGWSQRMISEDDRRLKKQAWNLWVAH